MKHRFLESARSSPNLWTSLAIGGAALVLAAVGAAVWMGSRAEPIEIATAPTGSDRGVTATTHQVLMGERPETALFDERSLARGGDPSDMDPSAAERVDGTPLARPLPPLVVVDETAPPAEGGEAAPQPGSPPAKAKASPSPAIPAPSAPKASRGAADREKVRIGGLSKGASVLKTHVLSSPSRFVIDLTGQNGTPEIPPASGAVKQIRYGVHPEHGRLVIDTERPIESGRISKNGGDLVVVLDYVRAKR